MAGESATAHLPATDAIAAAVNEASQAPSNKLPPGEWAKKNLFDGPINSMLSIVVGLIGLAGIWFALRWVIDADFKIVRDNLRIFMVGQFPREELWRLWASFFCLLFAGGLVAGALARSAYETNRAVGLPAEREGIVSLLRRFWAVIAVSIFFVSFARTLLPYVGVAVGFVLVFLGREIGWRLPEAARRSAIFIGASMAIVAMLILAGTSVLGGFALGLVVFFWVLTEVGRRDLPPGLAGTGMRFGVPLLAAAVVFAIEIAIPHDGFGWAEWGGLHVTLFTTVLGITLGMPFGIILALGRKSNLPVLKTASVIFIEFIRGVPLISLLLFSNLILPFFLPGDRPADLTLAIIVITGFSAAYIAEIVRGGLQAVPKGQTEAAQASGMSAASVQRLIVLPQALRAVIPAMVGQFIALFKDTSLLSIIGILEFLRVSDTSNAQTEFVGKGLASVTYLFVAIGYWAFAYTMSKESRRLEKKLGVGTR